MASIIEELDPARFEFRFVGAITPEGRALAGRLRHLATFRGHRPEAALREEYAWGDLFVLPTIQDGFSVVLLQAAIGGLPVLTTSHSAGTDLVREAVTGWVCPVRSPGSFVKRLRWCDENRAELAAMVRRLHETPPPCDWDRSVAALERVCGVPA
jgi:glycosyltransferase involved in cell wall biosynthesis